MVFNPNIPKADDLLSQSQQDLLNNNAYLNASFSVNHVPLNTATNNGKHTFVEMPVRGAIPAGLVASEGTLYTKSSTGSQLFFSPDNSGNEYQLTKTIAASFGRFASNNNGWTFLPGGLILQYGFINSPASTGTVLFTTANIDFPTNLFSVFFNFSRNATATDSFWIDSSQPFNKTRFSWKASTSTAANLYWVAIGN